MNKKILFLFAAVALVSCSSDNDEIANVTPGRVSVEIDATAGESLTRTYLGSIENNRMMVPFEPGELAKVFDLQGSYDFRCSLPAPQQNGTFKGEWSDTKEEGFAAVIPSTGCSVEFTGEYNIPVYTLSIPNTQTTNLILNGTQVSYDKGAGYLVAGRAKKYSDGVKPKPNAMYFEPVTSYLYFWSKKSTVTITSNNPIAGTLTVTPVDNNWQGADSAPSAVPTSGIVCTGGNTITATGTKVSRTNYPSEAPTDVYEYIVCIAPGTHELTFQVSGFGSKEAKSYTYNKEELYYLGCVDKE